MNSPKISIVTPSLNQGQFLEDTLASVLTQNYPNLEYVVIDGGSSDGSVDIIKKYENHLKYWVTEKDKGHGDALNKGFSHTTGEIMAWINSDDKYTPWAFETVAEIFNRQPDVMWIMGFNSWWNDKGAMTSASRVQKNIYDYLNGNYGWIQQESVFWRRSLWEKAGGQINTNYQLMVDGELWTRFFLHAELYTVDCILSGYRNHSNNRASLFYNKCCLEMEKAIAEMKKSCTKDVLNNYSKLKIIMQTREYPIFKTFPIIWLSQKFVYPSVLKEVEYKNIFYTAMGTWNKRTLPF